MRLVPSVSRGLDRFFAPQHQQALVVLRIALGLVLFGAYAARLPHAQRIFGPDGLGGFGLHQRVPGIAAGRPLEAPLQWLHRIDSPELVWLLFAVLLVASLAFAAGAWTRTAGAAALLLHAWFHARNFSAYGGWAVMIKPLLLFTLLAPVGRFVSVDAWRARRRGEVRGQSRGAGAGWLGPAAPLRLVQMHVCAIYAVVWLRLDDPAWVGGSALAVPLMDRWFGRVDADWLALRDPLRVLAYTALTLELLAPLLLWVPRVSRWWALGLIGMHLSLELLTNIGWWQGIMVPALFVFLPVAWVDPLFAILRAPFARAGAPARGDAEAPAETRG